MTLKNAISFFMFVLSFGNTAIADPFNVVSGNSMIEVNPGTPARYVIHNISAWVPDIRIVGHNHNDKECHTNGIVNVGLTRPAANGLVCIRIEDGRTRFNNKGTTPKCLGKEGKFAVVYFEPISGFTGTDKFEYTVDDTRGSIQIVAVVTVDISPPAAGGISVPALSKEATQKVGPVQLCPPLVD